MSYCTNCGAKLENDAVFCEECGTRVYPEATTTEEVVQAVVDEFNKQYYIEELRKTIIFAVIAVIVSMVVLSAMDGGMSSSGNFMISLFLAGIPSGWSIIGHILGGWTIIGGTAGIIFMMIRFILAVMIGLFALPIKIVYYIFKIRSASK